MGIRFLCPNGHKLNVKAFLAGQRGICPHCGERFLIPSESIKNIRVDSLGGPRSSGEGAAVVEEESDFADFAMQSHLVPTVPGQAPSIAAPREEQPEPSPATETAEPARAESQPEPQPAEAPAQRPFDQPDGVGGIALEVGEDFSIVAPQSNTPSAPIEEDLLAAGSRFEDLPDLDELAAAAHRAAPTAAPSTAPSPAPNAAPASGAPSAANAALPATGAAPAGSSAAPSGASQPAVSSGAERVAPAALPPAPPANVPLPGVDPISEFPHAVWYVRLVTGEQFGPAPGDAMRRWLDEGRVPPGCLVWREGWPEWRRSEATFAVVAQRVPPAIPGASPAVSAPASARPPSPTSSLGMGTAGSLAAGEPTSLAPVAPVETPAQPLPPAAVLAAKRRRSQRIMALIVGLLALAIVGLVPVLVYVLMRQ
ncbi:MAG: GYF domain-containing protein [Pirellulales bacterium]